MTDDEKLKRDVEALGQKRVAELAGISPTTLNSWLRGKAESMRAANRDKVIQAVRKLKDKGGDGIEHAGESFYPVPVYDIRAAAGAGQFVEDGDATTHQLMGSQWLGSLTASPLAMLSIIHVHGDSMENTLRPGDQILVDRTASRWMGDGIYVLLYDDVLQVKRLQRDRDGGMLILSDNPNYQPIKPQKGDKVQVIGMVLWMGRKLV
jgi:phage repressor protein C with HTH and peptisase S24 domain